MGFRLRPGVPGFVHITFLCRKNDQKTEHHRVALVLMQDLTNVVFGCIVVVQVYQRCGAEPQAVRVVHNGILRINRQFDSFVEVRERCLQLAIA